MLPPVYRGRFGRADPGDVPNWLAGVPRYVPGAIARRRDLLKAGKTGHGTWKLNACPMDGGGIVVARNGWSQRGGGTRDISGESRREGNRHRRRYGCRDRAARTVYTRSGQRRRACKRWSRESGRGSFSAKRRIPGYCGAFRRGCAGGLGKRRQNRRAAGSVRRESVRVFRVVLGRYRLPGAGSG